MSDDAGLLLVDRPRAGVLRITLNRPERHNALSHALVARLTGALVEAERDDRVRVVVLRGAGASFCAGADLDEHFVDGEEREDIGRSGLWDRLESLAVPVVAAVHGWAVTGGFLLAYCCDLIVAAESARFRDTHAALGLLPTGGESQRLPRLIGLALARELLYTSRPLDAHEAARAGLVNRVVPDDELEAASLELAEQVAAGHQRSIAALKRLVNAGARSDLAAGLRMEQFASGFGTANRTPDPDREERLSRARKRGGGRSGPWIRPAGRLGP